MWYSASMSRYASASTTLTATNLCVSMSSQQYTDPNPPFPRCSRTVSAQGGAQMSEKHTERCGNVVQTYNARWVSRAGRWIETSPAMFRAASSTCGT